MAANIQELQVAFSKTAQTAIDVASTDLVRFNSTSQDIADVDPVVEDDADEIGKGNEFAEESFLVAWKVSKKWECYLSAESLAIAAAFGLGSGTAGVYTPIDPITDTNQIELPWMTLLEGIRKGGATEVINRALLGMVVDKFSIKLAKGAGRANSKMSMDLMGTGLFDGATALAMPAKTPVHLLPAASLTCTINGTDYISAKSFESFDLDWDNNTRDGYFPGSGFQISGDPTSGQVQGRMEFGTRKLTASFTSRFQNGSTELTKLTAQTVGTAVLGLAGATGYNALMEFAQVTFKTAKVANENGIVTVKTDLSAQFDGTALSTGGLIKMTVNNTLGTVGRA
jgi:hypothetical protein